MGCPLCRTRRGRRACPALGQEICGVCCGTKRLVEIRCPADCPYLATAREHPPAVQIRREQRDLSLVMELLRDLNQRQSELFFLIAAFLSRYEPPELHSLMDDDVAGAAAALAATFETAVNGVIYEHRAPSPPAERLAAALKPALTEAGEGGGTPFQRDAAVLLRRIADAAGRARDPDTHNPQAFVNLLARVIRKSDDALPRTKDAPSRLIVP